MPKSVAEYHLKQVQQCWGFIVSKETEVDLAETHENMNQITADRIQFIGLKYWAAMSRLHKYIMLISSYKTFRGRGWVLFSGSVGKQRLRQTCRTASRSSPPPPLADIYDISLGSWWRRCWRIWRKHKQQSEHRALWLAESCIELYLTVFNLVRAVWTSLMKTGTKNKRQWTFLWPKTKWKGNKKSLWWWWRNISNISVNE